LFARDDAERDLHVAAVGPVWDGNEVWLITAGGALFAAFPAAYATSFSAFYLALTLVLFALIARVIGLEFRGQAGTPGMRRVWDLTFGIGSAVIAILLGVAFGNIMRGLPIEKGDAGFVHVGTFLGLLNPYALLIGVLSLFCFVLHGALWLAVKTDGALRERLARWAFRLWGVSVLLYLAATAATWFVAPHLIEKAASRAYLFWPVLLILVVAEVAIPASLKAGKPGWAFLSSAGAIAAMLSLAGLGLFPMLVPSSIDLAGASLTMQNASAKAGNLTVMLVITALGLPLVIVYHVVIYRIFAGKVQAGGTYG
jgi:cytochrome d ubiquinol oxidase subunit II